MLPPAEASSRAPGVSWACAPAASALPEHAHAAGPVENDGKEPEEREGLLWEQLRSCMDAGYKVDARSYYTAFRVTDKDNVGGLQEKLASLPEGASPPWPLHRGPCLHMQTLCMLLACTCAPEGAECGVRSLPGRVDHPTGVVPWPHAALQHINLMLILCTLH